MIGVDVVELVRECPRLLVLASTNPAHDDLKGCAARMRDAADRIAEFIAAAEGATEERYHNGASSKEACDRLISALSACKKEGV